MKTTERTLPVLGLVLASVASADGSGIYTVHDADGDGYLDRTEYTAYLENRRIRPEYRHLWAFDRVDRDGDGRISGAEMVQTLQEEMRLRAERRGK